MESNRENSNISMAILKIIKILIEYQKLFHILGAPIIFWWTVALIVAVCVQMWDIKRAEKSYQQPLFTAIIANYIYLNIFLLL